MEHYSDVKKNEIMNFGGKWIELKDCIGYRNPDLERQIPCFLSSKTHSSKSLDVSA